MNKKEISNHLIKLHDKLDNKVEDIIENLNDELELCKELINDVIDQTYDGFEMPVKVVRGMKNPPLEFSNFSEEEQQKVNRYRIKETPDHPYEVVVFCGKNAFAIEDDDYDVAMFDKTQLSNLIKVLQKVEKDIKEGKI
jgi:hypothetical protein